VTGPRPGTGTWRLAYRLRAGVPGDDWPLALRSVGHAVADARYHESVRPRPVLLVLWCLAGRGLVDCAGRAQRIGAGEWLWLPPGRRHGLAAEAARWELRWLTFDGPAVAPWAAAWGQGAASTRPVSPLAIGDHEWLLSAIEGPGIERRLACLERATALIAQGVHGDRADSLPARVAALVERHHTDSAFDVAALARRLDCHRSHLTRCLREQGSPPPTVLLRDRRLATAQRLLLAGASVAEAAASSGYAGADQLGRVFRQQHGCSPLAWRSRGGGVG
jgi:AraC-like DNA-binding protein